MKISNFLKGALLIGLVCSVLLAVTYTGRPTGGTKATPAAGPQPESNASRRDDSARPQGAAVDAVTQEDFEKDVARVEAGRQSRDLDEFIEAADRLEKKWGARDTELYGRLMLRVSNLIANGFDDPRIYALSQKYTSAALGKAENLSLELELNLLPFLDVDLAPMQAPGDGAAWAKERNTKAKLWLHAWRRLERELDRNFNFNDRPLLNVRPPAETGLPSGVSPEVIKNPTLRAKYEESIAKNDEKNRRYTHQYRLRLMEESFSPKAEQYLIRVYSQPPFDMKELKQYLETYVSDRRVRERIVKAVAQNISAPKARP